MRRIGLLLHFQRQKRTKGVAKSKFEDIPGVGKKTVEKIYTRDFKIPVI
jgi:excinuclease UvrABC nuclease subunit